MNYYEINRVSWNELTPLHVDSDFYDLDTFKKGSTSLNQIELEELGNVSGKNILHLQCHFGMDTLSLARLGAIVTGVDLSDVSIKFARQLSNELSIPARFINANIYELDEIINEEYDIIFTSYGAINWLNDLDDWAKLIQRFLKTTGFFYMVEFHPFVYTLDENDLEIKESYFKTSHLETLVETTYTDNSKAFKRNLKHIEWHHSLSEVISSFLDTGLRIESFKEFPYQVYNCFNKMIEVESGKWVFEKYGDKIPYMYSLKVIKS